MFAPIRIYVAFTNIADDQRFSMPVESATTVAYIKSSPEMARFIREVLRQEFDTSRLRATRSGRTCEDSETIESLGILPESTLYFILDPQAHQPSAKPDFFRQVPDTLEIPSIMRDEGYNLLAHVGLHARNVDVPPFEASPSAKQLIDITQQLSMGMTHPELLTINQAAQGTPMLSNFVSGAPAIIEKMTEDLREFFRCLAAVIEEILRSIAGQCKNPDFDGQIAGLLKDLFELHLKISGNNELFGLLAENQTQGCAIEEELKAVVAEPEGTKRFVAQLELYDRLIEVLKQRAQIVADYSARYNGFREPAAEHAEFLRRITTMHDRFNASTAECQRNIQMLSKNMTVYDNQSVAFISDLTQQERDLEETRQELLREGQQNAAQLMQLLAKEALRAARLKRVEDAAVVLAREKEAIEAHKATAHSQAEALTIVLERKIADNTLCAANVDVFHGAAEKTVQSLCEISKLRKAQLTGQQLDNALSLGSFAGQAYTVSDKLVRQSSKTIELVTPNLMRSELTLQSYLHQGLFDLAEGERKHCETQAAMLNDHRESEARFSSKRSEYSKDWDATRSEIDATAKELEVLVEPRPEDPAGVLIVLRPGADGTPVQVRFEHPDIAITIERERAQLAQQEIEAQLENLRIGGTA